MHNEREILNKAIVANYDLDYRKADKLYSSILKSHPNSPQANYLIGQLAIDLGKSEKAGYFLRKATELKPSSSFFGLSILIT